MGEPVGGICRLRSIFLVNGLKKKKKGVTQASLQKHLFNLLCFALFLCETVPDMHCNLQRTCKLNVGSDNHEVKAFHSAGAGPRWPCITLHSLLRIVQKVLSYTQILDCLIGWGCRIHWLHLCWGVRPSQRVSWIWHETIWWWGSSNAGALGNVEYPVIVIAPRSTLAWHGSTW